VHRTAGTISFHEKARLTQRRACLITICIMRGDFGEPSSPLADSAALNSNSTFCEKFCGKGVFFFVKLKWDKLVRTISVMVRLYVSEQVG